MKKGEKLLFWIAAPLFLLALTGSFFPTGARFAFLLLMAVSGFFAVYAAFGLLRKTGKGARAVKILHTLMWVFVGLCFVAFCAVEAVVIAGEHTDEPLPENAWVLVAGAGIDGDQPQLMLQYRLEKALAYLRENPESRAILCGGFGSGKQFSEAEVMYRWLSARGIDGGRLIREDASTDTRESFINAAQLLRQEGVAPGSRIVVVSTGFHLYRCRYLAEKNGCTAACLEADLPQIPFLWVAYHLREFGSVVIMYAESL